MFHIAKLKGDIMRNVMINEAESIFETYWDWGESYPEHQKYNALDKYQIKKDENARVEVIWCGVAVYLNCKGEGDVTKVSMARHCDFDITYFDVFRFFGIIPKDILFRINCVIDGEKKTVIEQYGKGECGEYDGRISGEKITEFELEFEFSKRGNSSATLKWLGFSNLERQMEMESRKSPYDAEWEGCFEENPEIKPLTGIYFDEEELKELRKKVEKEPYFTMMQKLRAQAEEDMKLEPEKDIGTYIGIMDKRWRRERDRIDKKQDIVRPMERLAFVGIIDGNMEMLKMACRMVLSISHYTYWCESIMGVFPGATWHHRSFSEEMICVACCKVLEWAGSLLTWHGKNIVYDAIIMKGMPRIQADIKTVDYIWYMNQGVIFDSSWILTLIFLQKRYPRYAYDLGYAEKSLIEMWENYCDKDGGVAEGPHYWHYTISNTINSIRMLAKYHNKTLAEYAPESIKRSSKYALCMLSDINQKTEVIPINDAHTGVSYSAAVSAFFAELTDDRRWDYSFAIAIQKAVPAQELIIFGKEFDEIPEFKLEEEYINLEYSGHTSLRRYDENVGFTRLFIQNQPILFSHTHQDKGSFVLEAASKPVLIDRGVCDYSNSYILTIGMPDQHNLLIPEREGFPYKQHKSDVKYSGKLIESSFEGNVFKYSVDLSNVWEEDVFEKNIRSFFSDNAKIFIVTDEVVCKDKTALSFRLNTYGDISEENGVYIIDCDGVKLKVEPINWKPEKAVYGGFGVDSEMRTVNQLALYVNPVKEIRLETKLEIL